MSVSSGISFLFEPIMLSAWVIKRSGTTSAVIGEVKPVPQPSLDNEEIRDPAANDIHVYLSLSTSNAQNRTFFDMATCFTFPPNRFGFYSLFFKSSLGLLPCKSFLQSASVRRQTHIPHMKKPLLSEFIPLFGQVLRFRRPRMIPTVSVFQRERSSFIS